MYLHQSPQTSLTRADVTRSCRSYLTILLCLLILMIVGHLVNSVLEEIMSSLLKIEDFSADGVTKLSLLLSEVSVLRNRPFLSLSLSVPCSISPSLLLSFFYPISPLSFLPPSPLRSLLPSLLLSLTPSLFSSLPPPLF